ncbi:sarcosine oxidase subunit gamma [Jannaschia seohaensis]|uniref:Sarcosine oxidase subunit gamma n=1 Tax=Jannaschia seohaensis TaxID=475081 RepID=A0A2Y9B6N8_9RHOB|nr:sarcosine oxidase subunit gamma [Jannaschia seohaensis]PWJ10335.1 sarcosine oxidase subunit gamma [Jannaschia seohaensis]SSA51735.1 sarcosine oxidase subunit gamma [Jannaschia seohaensis]
MASLIARSPAEGLLPVTCGALTLSEVVPEAITSLMALRDATFPLPAPGKAVQRGGGLLMWSGRNQALLIGPRPDQIPDIAMTDQSDAWAVLRLSGQGAADVLARLTPLDLRDAAFPEGAVARSLLGHMNAHFHRVDTETWDMMVFRSMTASAVHEILRGMRGVAARG